MSYCEPSATSFVVDSANPIRTVAEGGAYIASVCFKHGPPEHIGIELEWLLLDPSDPFRHPDAAILSAALRRHAPYTLNPDSPAAALPAGGLVTVEPGGQLEISSAPSTSIVDLIEAVQRDVGYLRALLEPTGFDLCGLAADPHRPPTRILHTQRYDAMAAAFDTISPAGRAMMCSTAATQVCVDVGPADQAGDRWRAAHYLGPVLLAAFANSPRISGEQSRFVSHRMASWWQLDPQRTLPPPSLEPGDYVQRALDTQVLARRRSQGSWQVKQPMTLRDWISSGEPISAGDIDLHLSMMFPPVRPQGYLELRYLDAQPAGQWIAPLGLVAALFATPDNIERVLHCCAEGSERWQQATEIGLADPVLRDCARALLTLAMSQLPRLDLPDPLTAGIERLLQRRLGEAISPAMEQLSAAVAKPAALTRQEVAG
ncbi:MAG TPA: glutamate-cysteine ligase family protein [Jatrophihabitans sp.]|nr:glutamate-cysteine ligase family protein [Jatrophihabitans sp.]